MILVSKKYATTFSSCPHEVFAPGRISKIQVLGEHSQMRVWNVHNFDISSSELVNFVQALQLDLTWAEGDPLTRSVFLAGDLNFQAAHEVRLPYAAPLNASSPTQGVGVRTLPTCPRILDFQRQTTPLLNQLIEITQPLPTHYQSHDSTGSKIDRVFTSNPPWTFPHSTFTFGVVDDPMDLHLKGISDHGALRLTVGKRRSCPKSAQTIAGEIFKHPKFAEFHKRLVEDTRLECLREYDRLLVHKQIIRSAAKQTREYIQDNEPGNNLMLCQNFTTCARAIWSNDVPLARRLIRNTCIGKTFLKIDGDSVMLLNATEFERQMTGAKHSYFNSLTSEGSPSCSPIHKKSTQNASARLARLSRLWVPIGKQLVLNGLRVGTQTIRDPTDMMSALGQHWSSTFAEKNVDLSGAEEFLQKFAKPFELSRVSPPSRFDIIEFLSQVSDSAPGPDGIPYSAWKAAGKVGVETLYQICLSLQSGASPPVFFNASLILFLTKGESELDSVEVIRSCMDTRPISLKNADNKIVTSVEIRCMRAGAQSSTHKTQNGFVPGRIFLNNVLDLDSASRIYSMHFIKSGHNAFNHPALIPILAFFDFAAAFPSVAHAWIRLVLVARGLPQGFINFILGLYSHNLAFYVVEGAHKFAFCFLSGVLQGCPASAFIFNLVLDPFLAMFEHALSVRARGVLRACADDIGVALRTLSQFKLMEPVFKLASKYAGLTLKPKKCVLIPLVPMTPGLYDSIRKWLHNEIPDWSNFRIDHAGKYLGFMLGPSAMVQQWASPLGKFVSRAQEVANSHPSVAIAAYAYNTKVVTVVGYVAQLFRLPKNAMQKERTAMQHILHTATNAFTHSDFFHLSTAGGPYLRSMCATARATLFRSAIKTVPHWPEWKMQIVTAAMESLPVSRIASGELYPSFWDGPPIAFNLDAAYRCFTGDVRWAPGARNAFQQISDKHSMDLSITTGGTSGGAPPAFYSDATYGNIKIQSIAYRCLADSAFPCTLVNTVHKRISMILNVDLDVLNLPEFDCACAELKRLRKHDAMCVVKTWVNSWATSARYHEDILLPCLLGCQEGCDSQKHYANCINIQIILEEMLLQPPRTPLERMGLQSAARNSMLACAAVFSAYHAVKRSPFVIGLDGSPLNNERASAAQRIFAAAFQSAADDSGLPCRSVSSFSPIAAQI